MKQTIKLAFLVTFLLSTIIYSCKKDAEKVKSDSSSTPKTSRYRLNTETRFTDAVHKAEMMYRRFKYFKNTIGKTDTIYTIDSTVFYLETSLSIAAANASTYLIDTKMFRHYIDISGYEDFTESQIATLYSDALTLISGDLSSVSYSDKRVYSIQVEYLPVSEESSVPYFCYTIKIGHQDYNEAWASIDPYSYDPFTYYNDMRYNYNGGWFSDPYLTEASRPNGRQGAFNDNGTIRGYDYGGARALEEKSNDMWWYYLIQLYGSDFGYATESGKKVIGVKNTPIAGFIYANDPEVLATSTDNPNSTWSYLAPTYIFCYSWFNYGFFYDLAPITGAQMNYYLHHTLPIMASSTLKPVPSGKAFGGLNITGRSIVSIQTAPFTPNATNSKHADPIIYNSTVYDRYHEHKYVKTTQELVLVTDPDSQ